MLLARPQAAIRELITGGRLTKEKLGADLTRFRLSSRPSRLLGLVVSPYLYGDILIDTGFAHVHNLVVEHLAGHSIAAICCTHHHEDHSGNCASLARDKGCPVYLHHADALWEEGVGKLPLYRRLWWGPPEPYEAKEMPAEVRGSRHVLRSIPTPGHSRTHVALFDEQTGLLFSGDLFVSSGASAVMTHENPFELASSLRRLAALTPARMLTGHGLTLDQPEELLLTKASRIEEAAGLTIQLSEQGLPLEQICQQVFPRRSIKQQWMTWMTRGEFATINFVRAVIRHRD